MNTKVYVLLIGLLLFSCNNAEKQTVYISNQERLELLNEILSDTIELKLITSKTQLISNYSYMVPPRRKRIKQFKFICDSLKVKDTMFIRNQFLNNKTFDLNQLTNYGYNMFDLKTKIENNMPHDTLLKLIDSLNRGTKNYSLLKISKPIFNEDKNLVYIRTEQGSGGDSYILEKIKDKWTEKYHLAQWVE